MQEPTEKELFKLRAVADYLFGRGVGQALFPDSVQVLKSRGRIRQVISADEPLCSIRASDGFIVLNRKGAELVHRALKPPRLRVVVSDDAAPFVAQGKTVFAKHIVAADPEIRPAEEVLVVDSRDRLLASGKTLLTGEEMIAFKAGKAVEVRRGFGVENEGMEKRSKGHS
ncbi:MAG: PUA domain-containing protein [Candidatus Hadarchaeaceae archaeon]